MEGLKPTSYALVVSESARIEILDIPCSRVTIHVVNDAGLIRNSGFIVIQDVVWDCCAETRNWLARHLAAPASGCSVLCACFELFKRNVEHAHNVCFSSFERGTLRGITSKGPVVDSARLSSATGYGLSMGHISSRRAST